MLKQQIGDVNRASLRAVEELREQVKGLSDAMGDGNLPSTPIEGQCLLREMIDTERTERSESTDLFEDMPHGVSTEPAEPTERTHAPRSRSAVRLTDANSLPSQTVQLEMLQKEVDALKEQAVFQSSMQNRSIEDEMARSQNLASSLHIVQQQSGHLQEASSAVANDLKDVLKAVLETSDLSERVRILDDKYNDLEDLTDVRDEVFDLKAQVSNLQPRTRRTIRFNDDNSAAVVSTMSNASTTSTVINESAAAEASQQIQGIMKRLDDIQAASSDVLREVGTSFEVLRAEVQHSMGNGCNMDLQSKLNENVADLRQQLTHLFELCAGNRSNTDAAMAAGSSFEVSVPLPVTAELPTQVTGEDSECEEEAIVQEFHKFLRNEVTPLARDIESLQQGHAHLERAVAACKVLAAGSALVDSMYEQF